MRRAQEQRVETDLSEKIVFLSGPRQVGKTTLSKNLSSVYSAISYFNYDSAEDRTVILKKRWDRKSDLVILDEVHKFRRWKTLIKGIFDTEGVRPRLLVTGSARLDVYRRGGDSLAGRFHRHRLLPFSVAELAHQGKPEEILRHLMKFGGFPEPYLHQSETWAKRWRKSHLERIIREDVQDLEPVSEIQSLALLVELLRSRVGGQVSYLSLAEDLQVSPHTIKRWISILENMYVCFRVFPWTRHVARSILKMPKIYFFDTGQVLGDEGARLENAVAVSLLKHLWFLEDTEGSDVDLRYVRDKEGHEVDFVTVIDRQPKELIEVKLSGEDVAPGIRHHARKLSIPATQLVRDLRRPLEIARVRLQPAAGYLAKLAL